ncbi:hypothetical protein SAMN05192532_103319 [Alteribacillus iranensis]|uniref:Iron complex transport system substrate-binding protein n=3 Tax=Alteribacillus iranensis TaxID=930128 RepID=A0A1I2D0D7_9BACI|nr:hypothetical protein SAMN05192532_103319 [Alteribacillus iranensis]
MKKRLAALLIGLVFASLAACSNDDGQAGEELADDIKNIVNDYSTGEAQTASASITSHELIIQSSEGEATYDLPEDEFFVSIAPYEKETHT